MTMNSRSARWLALVLLFVACSWGVASATPPAQVHDIEISGMKYQPDVMTFYVGDTVMWKNSDIFPHTVTAVDKSFSSPAIPPGGTWKFVTKKTGAFAYACTPHPNMSGKLIVE
jgi:plastocyanin